MITDYNDDDGEDIPIIEDEFTFSEADEDSFKDFISRQLYREDLEDGD